MALYAGLAPQDALAKWYAIRQKPQDQLTPEEKEDVAGNMIGLSEQNPDAWKVVKTGANDNGKTKQIFNPQTGQWDEQKDKGLFSNWETWAQLAAGAGLGAAVAIPAIAGAGGASAASAAPAATAATTGGTTAATTGGLMSTAGGYLKKLATDKAMGAIGNAIGGADQQAAQNRTAGTDLSLKANQENVSGQSAYESELMNRAKEDAAQRQSALKDLYLSSYTQNPRVSPYNPAGAPKYSPAYMDALKGLETQATARLAKPSDYNLNTAPGLTPYSPIDRNNVMGSTGNGQSWLSKLAGYASPALTVASKTGMFNGSNPSSFKGGTTAGSPDDYSYLNDFIG